MLPRLVLGSRSPRRRELLLLLVPVEQIDVRPPRQSDEPGFDGLTTWLGIAQQLQEIARRKNDDVCEQLRGDTAMQTAATTSLVLTADTTIVTTNSEGTLQVLGQPPDSPDWQCVVGRWFRELYAGRSHIAVTAVCLTDWKTGRRLERLAQSHVWMREDLGPLLDWYFATNEPLGKAGGYALQGLGSVFVTRVEGSISNVVGLPLEVLLDMLPQFGWSLAQPRL